MKTIKKTVPILFLNLLLLFTTTSCFINGISGNGDVEIRSRKISDDFVKIKASSGVDVVITYGEKASLKVEADSNLHDIIKTEVVDGTLFISTENKNIMSGTKKVLVSVNSLNEIGASSGSYVISNNMINAETLELSATSGADLKLKVDAQYLTGSSTSGARIKLSGEAQEFKASATSGADINAYDLNVDKCTASATSGADIKVKVNGELNASASSGGDVRYKGSPAKISKNESAAGDVSKS